MPSSRNPDIDHAARVVRLTGGHNVRDLGGLPTTDGRRTRFGRLLRGEFMDLLAEGDAQILVDTMGLRTVVDLRRKSETVAASAEWAAHNVRVVHCPFGLGGRAPVHGAGEGFLKSYLAYVEAGAEQVLQAVTELSRPGSHPAMFHCAAGKDRTGVLGAIILDVLGVRRDAIAHDYAMSADGMEHVLTRLAQLEPYREMLDGWTIEQHVPDPAVILEFLRRLDESHGGAAGWLGGQGIDAPSLDRFRAVMLERA
jgi:hypothetical protein